MAGLTYGTDMRRAIDLPVLSRLPLGRQSQPVPASGGATARVLKVRVRPHRHRPNVGSALGLAMASLIQYSFPLLNMGPLTCANTT
jgi:hypothetical protein